MTVIQTLQSLSNSISVNQAGSQPSGLKPFAPVDVEGRADLLRARTRLLRLFRALESLAEAAGVDTRTLLDIGDARSRSALGLDLTRTAARLDSSNEINASPMSFTPFGPDWDDGSSALITIGGEYDGTHGSGPLTFEVRRAGTRGQDNLRIRVEDSQGNRIRNINIRRNHAEDRQYDLRNGLYLTLGQGDLINRDTTSIQVYDNVGAAVDPNLPLGGVRNQNPNLEFGTTPIADGAFQLNGVQINVATTDTINDVLDNINQSAAGVTATFNATTERIEFQHDTIGSAGTIDLSGDTSNFLAATKLDSANTVAGRDADNESALSTVAAFSSIQSGSIVINNESIAVDTSTDSLDDVIDRINASNAGVTASFDAGTRKVLIRAGDTTSNLDIDDNGTGFFPAIDIAEGQYERTEKGRGIGRRQSYVIADRLESTFTELNSLFRDSTFLGRGEGMEAFRAPLESALRGAFGDAFDDGLGGLFVDASNEARLRGGYASLDRRELTSNLQTRADPVMNLLRGRGEDRGLVERLLIGAQQAVRAVNFELGISGGVIDTFA